MERNESSYVLENYGKQSTFASFLPGISGMRGIPVWCFYANRGQAVTSFGVDNKENSIMAFAPAHEAYQRVKTTGFRTFIKKAGAVYEPFADDNVPNKMKISMNLLELEEENGESGLRTQVWYYTLPNENIGALVRTLTVTNTSGQAVALEVLDGMPALVPFGVSLSHIKEIGQTAQAWMRVEDAEKRTPFFRASASLEDSAEVTTVDAGHFGLGFREDGSLLPVIVDPALVFLYDSSMRDAVHFREAPLRDILSQEQVTANEYPCCFFGEERVLGPGESLVMHEVFGRAASKEVLHAYARTRRTADYFDAKLAEACRLTDELTSKVRTTTASKAFDAYCRSNYLDNLLRGGYPIRLGKDKIFYVYSRKHGDMERDYNFFAMLPEYYSQGNGNFRDVNQNRRCDTFFAPFVGQENIRKFYSLIQLDGYNPLHIEKLTYSLPQEKAAGILGEKASELNRLLTKPFTPGALAMALEKAFDAKQAEKLFDEMMDAADAVINEEFGEGYWSDHWTYNLDLVEDYLEVYPDREEELFFAEDLTCFCSQMNINDRRKRYVETPRGLRQYRALNEDSRRDAAEKWVRTRQGDLLKMSLMEKLVLMCAVKFATLDAYGMGVEMEGGKPGWYDALNGLPGMLGSSMNESYELCRMLEYTIRTLKKHGRSLPVLEEVAALLGQLDDVNSRHRGAIHACDGVLTPDDVRANGQVLGFWNQVNDLKEAYRNQVFEGVSGAKVQMDAAELIRILTGFTDTVRSGIRKAKVMGQGGIPAYFAFDVTAYNQTEDGIEPLNFVPVSTPPFLEGAVRYLKLDDTPEQKRAIYEQVKASDLYDRALKMYKVNSSLISASYELGRAVAFLPGWLENESIWLHMEYKYLLELIRSGLYQEFFADLRDTLVPFMDSSVYGRSIYENSSFLVSSGYPNKALHGKGFVARLSGSTVEFISIWKRMMFGAHVLEMRDGELTFTPQPALPDYLIPEDGRVSATLFGEVEVDYHFGQRRDYIPGAYEIRSMTFVYRDGMTVTCAGPVAEGNIPDDLRTGRIGKVSIEIA